MIEWKELQIDNLPPDILTGNYEWEMFNKDKREFVKCGLTAHSIITELMNKHCKYSFAYIKKEPKQPTHEEIMKPKYWQCDNSDYWRCITGVRQHNDKTQYLIYDGWCDGDYFTGRESADIPPE